MNRSIIVASLFICLSGFTVLPGYGQAKSTEAGIIEQRFSDVWNRSKSSFRNYSWKVRTEVKRDDEVIQVLTEEVTFDVRGKEVRKVISNQEAPLPSIAVIRDIAENRKSRIVEFMTGLRALLEQYALDGDSIRGAFFSHAAINGPDKSGLIQVSGTDVLVEGDKLKWWIDTRSYSIAYATVTTIYQGVHSEFSATYYLLPGLNYMSQAMIKIPYYDMLVTLKFYDYIRK